MALNVSGVARQAGVSPDAIRFYEREGLLPAASRSPSGYREYPPSTVERIRLARMLQNLGFTLDEIIDMLHAHDAGTATCDSEQWRLEGALERIDTKIAELRRTRRQITTAMRECRTGRCRFTSIGADRPTPG